MPVKVQFPTLAPGKLILQMGGKAGLCIVKSTPGHCNLFERFRSSRRYGAPWKCFHASSRTPPFAASPPRGPQALGHPVCALMSEAGDAEPRKESEEALVHALKATCLEPGMRKPLLSGPCNGAGQRPRQCPWQPYVPSHWAPRYPPPQGLQRTLLVGLT